MIIREGVCPNPEWEFIEFECEKTHVRIRRSMSKTIKWSPDYELFEMDYEKEGKPISEEVFEIIKKILI
jgi:hypothetical protein